MEIKIGGKYRLIKKIGSGSCGGIYSALNVKSNERVAVKMELIQSKNPIIQYEYNLYKYLSGIPGVPKAYYFGTEGDYYVMVLEMLGPSLEALHIYCGRKFSEMTVAMIAV